MATCDVTGCIILAELVEQFTAVLLEMDACHTYLHLNISMTLKRAGIDLQRHKCSRNADSLHHQSAHDREISVFKFLLLSLEKVGIIHMTKESLTYTNVVT